LAVSHSLRFNSLVTAVWVRARAEMRTDWRAAVAVVALLMIGGAAVIAAVAGARRTQTAMQRFITYDRPEDVSVFFDPLPGYRQRVLALPEVARTTSVPYMMVSTNPTRLTNVSVFGASDDTLLSSIDRPLVVHGRQAQRDRPDEAVITDVGARQSGLHIGSSVKLYAFSRPQVDLISQGGFTGSERPQGPVFTARIVGIIREPTGIAVVPIHQDTVYDTSGEMYLTPAFMHEYARLMNFPYDDMPGNEIVRVQLRHGSADVAKFVSDVDRVGQGHVQVSPGSDARITAAGVQHAVDVESIALLMFAAVAAIAVIVLVSLNLARMMSSKNREYSEMRALGATRRLLVATAIVVPLAVIVTGTALAVGLAIAVSPLMPIGIARQAELHPGVAVNVALIAATAGAILLILGVAAVLAAISATRTRTASARAWRARRSGVHPRFGPAASIGFDAVSSRDAAGSRRVATVAIAFAVAATLIAATFISSLDHVVSSPKQQGWTFDVVAGNLNDQNDQMARDVPLLARNGNVAGFTAIASPPEVPTIDGRSIPVVGAQQIAGSVGPVMLEGRFVRAPDEIVLGRTSLRALHKRIGDTVDLTAGGRHAQMRVTGTALWVSAGNVFTGRLDEGAVVTVDGLKRVTPEAFVPLFLVKFAPHVDHHAALASIKRDFGHDMLQHVAAQQVESLTRIDALPIVLAALLAFIGLTTLAGNLLASVRRRRRTFATLKAIGLERPQLAISVLWQTWMVTALGVVVGVPVGVLVGRAVWRFVADQIGSVQPPVVSGPFVALTVVAAATCTTLVALVPAIRAARVCPPIALRDE
jgi:hypothetical protein